MFAFVRQPQKHISINYFLSLIYTSSVDSCLFTTSLLKSTSTPSLLLNVHLHTVRQCSASPIQFSLGHAKGDPVRGGCLAYTYITAGLDHISYTITALIQHRSTYHHTSSHSQGHHLHSPHLRHQAPQATVHLEPVGNYLMVTTGIRSRDSNPEKAVVTIVTSPNHHRPRGIRSRNLP